MQKSINYLSITKNFLLQVKKATRLGTFRISVFRYFPNYLRDNKNEYFSHLKISKPWITYSSCNFLLKNLKSDMKVFEFGSGGSTLFYSSRVLEVISVEHDKNWAEDVKKVLKEREINNVMLNLCEPIKKGDNSNLELGYYTKYGRGWEEYDFTPYVTKIDEYPDAYFDVLVIDGRARPFCLKHGLQKVKPGGFIVYDNLERFSYMDEFYSSIEKWKVHEGYGPVIGFNAFTNTHIYQVPNN